MQEPSPPASELLEQLQQQDSDTEDQPQPQPQPPPISESLPDSENSAVQQPIDDSVASDQVSHSSKVIEEDEDSEAHYEQQYEEFHNVASDQEPSDAQEYLEMLPSASGRAAYHGPMKSKGNVPRVRLIAAEGDEEGIISREEGKGIHAYNNNVCVHMFVHLYAKCNPQL